jgi:hemerythrin-like domain-containing protein
MKGVLEAWRESASTEARNALAEAVEQFVPLLNEHLTLKEEFVVPLIDQLLTAEEYSRVAEDGDLLRGRRWEGPFARF